MSDIRESFPTTENGSGVGVPLASVVEGDAAAAKNAAPHLVAKDPSGNLIYLRTNAAGAILVLPNDGGTPKWAAGLLTGQATFGPVVDVALVTGKTYTGLAWSTSCFRDAIFEFVLIDDVGGANTETYLGGSLSGPGDFSDSGKMDDIKFVAAGPVSVLRVRAKNLNALSDMRASVSVREQV